MRAELRRTSRCGLAQVVTGAIIRSVSQLKHASGILFLFFLVFAILGVGFFKGTLKHRCFYETTPDLYNSTPSLYRNMSRKEFFAEWTTAIGDFMTSTRSLQILSPILNRLNVSVVKLTSDLLANASLKSEVEEQAYADNLWRVGRPGCDGPVVPGGPENLGPGLLLCDELYIPPLCADPVDAKDRISAGGYQCQPDNNGFRTVCRASSPFFEVPNNNPPYFKGWCALDRGRGALTPSSRRFCS